MCSAERAFISLSPRTQGREHIHFAKGLPGKSGVVSGMRTDSKVIILIDAVKILTDGIPLFESFNGVICCPCDLDKKYFHKVIIPGLVPDEFYTRIAYY